jgi:putative transposase
MTEILLLQKENEILRRILNRRPIRTQRAERVFIALLNFFSSVKEKIRIVKPETLLGWQKQIIRRRWTYASRKSKLGRPPISKETRDLILKMKNENPDFFGAGHIQGELRKIGIQISEPTIRRILASFRKRGKITSSLSWAKFLKMQIGSIYAMDFFTVDTIRGIRFYVYFIIKHETRQIIQFAVTQNPVQNFVSQQIMLFREQVAEKSCDLVRMIHDNDGAFFDLDPYGIQSVRTSVSSPNMNSIAERLIGTVRRECLDWFFILSENQLRRILAEFINHYNSRRPHQGLAQDSPLGYAAQTCGHIASRPVLSGLFQDYYRSENALT